MEPILFHYTMIECLEQLRERHIEENTERIARSHRTAGLVARVRSCFRAATPTRAFATAG